MLDPGRESAQAIERAALAWAARVDRGSLTEAEDVALKAWTAEDPRRAGAFARAMAANAYFDRSAALGQHYEPPRHPFHARIGRRNLILAGSSALAASVAAGFFGLRFLAGDPHIATTKGDIRRVALAEGSAVTLNTDTTIQPHLGTSLRRVNLLRGEALFDVAKDPTRPFVVLAGETRVRAVGTSFSVRLHEDGRVAVAVREGIVEVSRKSEPPLRLIRGESALAAPGRPLAAQAISDQDLERSLIWRDGRLDLTGMSLAEAVAEFARYSDRRIVIDGPAIARRKVAGVYSTSDPVGFARAAALSLGLTVSDNGGVIRIGEPEATGKN